MKTRVITEENQSVRELAWIISPRATPIILGASLGGIGRATDEQWIPAAPLAMDLFWGAKYNSARGLLGLAEYGLGVALPYADKIYFVVEQNLPKLSKILEDIGQQPFF